MTKEILLKLVGPFPNKASLKPVVLESIDCGEYIREKIEYSVESNERVRAYLLFPQGASGKKPAIFCHHQHSGNFNLGKSEVVGLAGDPDQAYAVELAKRGYVTFAPDAISFEERNVSKIPRRAEYFELSKRLVKGCTLLAKVLHDISVGLDYLESREEVDKNKIGFIGHSYGGRMAFFAPALDKRIKASVSNCYSVNYESYMKRDLGVPVELCVPNITEYGDIEDVVRMVEPSSLYISAASNDKWSQDAQKIYDRARTAFIRGELKLKIWSGEHIFTKEMRQEAYSFLDKHLKDKDVR